MQKIKLNLFKDERGWFTEVCRSFKLPYIFVQDNMSFSKKNVLRGLHYQKEVPQAKLIIVLKGEIFDVAVDLRTGQYESVVLSKNEYVLIDKNYAHGFCVLSKDAQIYYKCSEFYYPRLEAGIIWNDDTLAINWPIDNPILSEKDSKWGGFKNVKM